MNDEKNTTLGRRTLLRSATVFGGGLYLALNAPRPQALAAMSGKHALVLTHEQWVTVQAISGRIVPTDHQPGAIEANCVNFIDKALANEDAQSRPAFIAGLASFQLFCIKSKGKTFTKLDTEQQDRALIATANGKASPWSHEAPPAHVFFEMLRAMTIMGFMADPKYGGNADMNGWRVARYPGPRHHAGGYTPKQMLGEEKIITLWGEEM